MTTLNQLNALGQSPWLDFIRRDNTRDGQLAALRDKGITGVTSNPAIFEQAIAGSHVYDEEIIRMASEGMNAYEIYDHLSVTDVQEACDVFRPVYDATDGADGYVSLEVSPLLAHDTNATIMDAHRLWGLVNRPNVMIKIPATLAGVDAIRQCLTDGLNINVTLLFGIERYDRIMEAYIQAMEARAAIGMNLRVASVASFFVSRVDTLLDPELESRGVNELVGRLAIANAQVAYARFRETFDGLSFSALAAEGAWKQRILWASTSSKNPAFSPVKYVEALVGPDSVDTMPLATIDAYLQIGDPQDRLAGSYESACVALEQAEELGIEMGEVAQRLEADAIQKFVDPFQKLITSIESKRATKV